jgi:hypothetical protein
MATLDQLLSMIEQNCWQDAALSAGNMGTQEATAAREEARERQSPTKAVLRRLIRSVGLPMTVVARIERGRHLRPRLTRSAGLLRLGPMRS